MSVLNSVVQKLSKSVWVVIGMGLLITIAVGDYITGSEISFSLFYLLPIAIFSMALSGMAGVMVAFISAAIWLFIEVLTTEDASSFVHLWNTIIRLGFFLLPAILLRAIEQERRLARTDPLTGAINNRYFTELLQHEIDRSNRYSRPFTLAFIDFDNFKAINDTFGHTFGNTLLHSFAEYVRSNLRRTDYIARVGGDEFVILLPEADEKAARIAVTNLFRKISHEMNGRKWPITFSVGVLTMNAPKISVDKILSTADKMMYSVKNNGKNDIKFATHVND